MPPQKAVFIVDDDPSMLDCISGLVRQRGFETVLFNSVGAVKHHRNFEQAFCIVLDIGLSDGSGIELRQWLASSGVTVPVIFITGDDGDATRTAAIQAGCIAFLTKPFSAKSLIEPIHRAWVNYGTAGREHS